MCGISVIIDIEQKLNESELSEKIGRMNQRIVHRGPDAEGIYVKDNIGFGHRRLSIIDLSEKANQPFQYKHYRVVFNGEIYNYLELREELIKLGYEFTTDSDTEIIPAAYDAWGKEALHRFNGMWAFAIYNEEKKELFFSRDRYGIKPLYHCITDSRIFLFSEIKQLLDQEEFNKELNQEIIDDFIEKGYLNHDHRSFFRDVFEVRAGYCGTYYNNKFEIHQWYDLKKRTGKIEEGSYDEIVKKTGEIFRESVRLRLRSDVKVGSCLSGGIDSSSIVSVVEKNDLYKGLLTITSTHSEKFFDETQYSDLVCREFGTENIKVYPELKGLLTQGRLKKINYHQDQPIKSCSHINEYEVFREAREQDLIVMLDGQGADEYFLGYGEFEWQYYLDLFKGMKFISLWKAMNSFRKNRGEKPIALLRRTLSYVKSLLLKKTTLHRAKISQSTDDLIFEELNSISIPFQLHSEDRNSMMNSVESRLPFLDYRLVEYIYSIPPELKLNQGRFKALLRDGITELPVEIKNRKDKMGFVAPDHVFVDNNKEAIMELSKILFDKKLIRKMPDPNDDFHHAFRVTSLHQWLSSFEIV